MLKTILPVLAILLAVTAARGQTPQTAQDYLDSSTAQFQKGDADKALADVNKAVELNPNYIDAFALRAAIRRRQGDVEVALADYSQTGG